MEYFPIFSYIVLVALIFHANLANHRVFRSRQPAEFREKTEVSLLYKYRNLRAKKHRDTNSLFALEKPADWSHDFFTSEKRRIDAQIGYIIFTREQNRIARSPLL